MKDYIQVPPGKDFEIWRPRPGALEISMPYCWIELSVSWPWPVDLGFGFVIDKFGFEISLSLLVVRFSFTVDKSVR